MNRTDSFGFRAWLTSCLLVKKQVEYVQKFHPRCSHTALAENSAIFHECSLHFPTDECLVVFVDPGERFRMGFQSPTIGVDAVEIGPPKV